MLWHHVPHQPSRCKGATQRPSRRILSHPRCHRRKLSTKGVSPPSLPQRRGPLPRLSGPRRPQRSRGVPPPSRGRSKPAPSQPRRPHLRLRLRPGPAHLRRHRSAPLAREYRSDARAAVPRHAHGCRASSCARLPCLICLRHMLCASVKSTLECGRYARVWKVRSSVKSTLECEKYARVRYCRPSRPPRQRSCAF